MPVQRALAFDSRSPRGESPARGFRAAGRWPDRLHQRQPFRRESGDPRPLALEGRYLKSSVAPLLGCQVLLNFFPKLNALPLAQRPVAILFRNRRDDRRPLNAKRRIIESHAPRCTWCVKCGCHIVHLCRFLEGLISVRTVLGYIKHPSIRSTQFHAVPLAV